ncbi:MAG: carbonic anhydrase [Polyangiaceae bacterium]
MNHLFRILLLVFIVATSASCGQSKPKKAVTSRKKPVPSAAASASASALPRAHASASAAPAHSGNGQEAHAEGARDGTGKRFALPFAWESEDNEPLAKTRAFVRDVLKDNFDYMKQGPKFFGSFAKAQKPRATVVACSDSRVQNAAWDITPENDDFTIRNIGNQLATSLGSVEYGVEHLNTAVLFVVGHTGCGAVKAAMSDKSHLSPAIRNEIDALVLPKEFEGETSDTAWANAVVENVHIQVRAGLEQFGSLVTEGRLTIVGAVYDFRNDLGKGAGKLVIVDVNGNSEATRIDAFVAAVSGIGKKTLAAGSDLPPVASPGSPQGDAESSLEGVTNKLNKLIGQQGHEGPSH